MPGSEVHPFAWGHWHGAFKEYGKVQITLRYVCMGCNASMTCSISTSSRAKEQVVVVGAFGKFGILELEIRLMGGERAAGREPQGCWVTPSSTAVAPRLSSPAQPMVLPGVLSDSYDFSHSAAVASFRILRFMDLFQNLPKTQRITSLRAYLWRWILQAQPLAAPNCFSEQLKAAGDNLVLGLRPQVRGSLCNLQGFHCA